MQIIPLVDIEDLPDDLGEMVERWRRVEDGDPNFIRTLANAPEMLTELLWLLAVVRGAARVGAVLDVPAGA